MRHDEPATMMHLIRPLLLLIVVFALLMVAERVAGDSLRVHDVAGSDGPEVLLSHVAELEGDYAAGFGQVVVGRFEADESEIEIETSTILETIRAEGAKLGMLDFSGFTRVTVHRTFGQAAEVAEPAQGDEPAANVESGARGEALTVYTPTTVQALIEKVISDRTGFGQHELAITFNERDAALLAQSAVAGRYEVEPVAEPSLGAVAFKVTGYRGTQPIDSGKTVTARVQRRVIAVIAGEMISRGQMIHRRQVRLREVLIDDVNQPYLGDTGLVTGQVAAESLRPGALVTAGSVRLPVAVSRRQQVAVELNTGGIRITFNGTAQQAGAVGETIEVLNAKTGQRFNATIVGRGKVVAGEAVSDEKEGQE